MGKQSKAAQAAGQVPSQPTTARVYNYLLGGRDNYSVDRDTSQRMLQEVPGIPAGVRAQRAVARRAVRYLVGQAGVRQLLDIGAGLPVQPNVHQVAQGITPATRVVYVDNDEGVLAYARAILMENPQTAVVSGDLRVPDGIINDPMVRAHLDWASPIGVLLCGILHLITDSDRPGELMARLIAALPPGSYVFIQHLLDLDDPVAVQLKMTMTRTFSDVQFRSMDQVRELFRGLELVEPGLVRVPDWRPDMDAAPGDPGSAPAALGLACAGLGRKP